MLSFQITDSGKSIQIDCDDDGLERLISALDNMKGEKGGHVHLRALSAGGNTLSDSTPWGADAVGEVIITLR